MRPSRSLIGVAVAAFLPFTIVAHHSRAACDTTKEVQLETIDLSLTQPVTMRTQWIHRPDLEPESVECDLELSERFLNE